MNINQIAKLAGVSRATVSRYLNNGYVSQEKKEQIKKVIDETGYKPSSQAQMLRTKKSGLIGVIIPKINSDAIGRMVAGISIAIAKEGFQLLLANTDNKADEEIKYLQLFKKNQVDGIILIGTIFTKKHIQALKEVSVPIVILGQHLKGYSSVYYDDYNAAKDITEVLLKNCKKIGYLGVIEKDEAAGRSRKNGFLDALKNREQEIIMEEGEFTLESGYQMAKRLLSVEQNVDGIFCSTDNIAIGAMKYIKEIGKKIPQDIAIIGIGDTQISTIIEPALTTVHYFYKTSGIEAAQMLMDMIGTEERITKELKMGYQIILRQST